MPFEYYTASDLWADEHTSQKMLEYHLNESVDLSSRSIGFIRKSAEWIAEHFGLNSHSGLIDFGCGPGLYTSLFAEKKIRVSGIDFSRRSVEYAVNAAEERGLDVDYVNADYLEYEPMEKYDLVTMIMCDFCALSPGQRKTMLEKFKRILKPDGAILLDVFSLNFFDSREETAVYEFNQLSNFWSADDYYSFQNTFKYDREKVLLDKYTIIGKKDKREVYNWLQCFSPESLKKELNESGIEVSEIYSDVAGSGYREDSPEFAIVGRI